MTDEELLEHAETHLVYVMLSGCATETHLGYKKHDPCSWAVTFRADELSRLIDLAKEGAKK